MKLLALDTASDACSAAVCIDQMIVSSQFKLAPRRHTELIFPMLEQVLAAAGVTVDELDAVVFGRGPGSFTGVRLAASVTQGIAVAANLAVIPVSTLAATAYYTIQEQTVEQVAVAFDARMGEVYWGLYSSDVKYGVIAMLDECVCAPDQVPVVSITKPCHGSGNGWQVYHAILQERLAVQKHWPAYFPSAAAMAVLAAKAWQQDPATAVSAEHALPVYLRDNVAAKPAAKKN